MPEVTDSDILRAAVQVLERDGHCKHTLVNANGEHCAMGAIYQARDELDASKWADSALRVLATFFDKLGMPLPMWNDRPETTMQDVQKLFLQTADELEWVDA